MLFNPSFTQVALVALFHVLLNLLLLAWLLDKVSSAEATSEATKWVLTTLDRPRSAPSSQSKLDIDIVPANIAPPATKMNSSKNTTVLVSQLALDVDEVALRNFFAACGNIIFCQIPKEQKTTAYLGFSSKKEARNALQFDGSLLMGRSLKVELAKNMPAGLPTFSMPTSSSAGGETSATAKRKKPKRRRRKVIICFSLLNNSPCKHSIFHTKQSMYCVQSSNETANSKSPNETADSKSPNETANSKSPNETANSKSPNETANSGQAALSKSPANSSHAALLKQLMEAVRKVMHIFYVW